MRWNLCIFLSLLTNKLGINLLLKLQLTCFTTPLSLAAGAVDCVAGAAAVFVVLISFLFLCVFIKLLMNFLQNEAGCAL